MSWKPGQWRNKAITGAQKSFIEDIKKELQQPFTGDNRGKASDYIDATIMDFHDSKQKKREGRAPKEKPTIIKLQEAKRKENMSKLYLASRRVKFEENEKETTKHKLFRDREEAINFIVDSVISDHGPAMCEEEEKDIPTRESLRERYDKYGAIGWASSIEYNDDNGIYHDESFEVEYRVEEVDFLNYQMPKDMFKAKELWEQRESEKNVKLVTMKTSESIKYEDEALKIYHAYQYDFLEKNNISIRDFIKTIGDRQVGHKSRFHEELSLKDAYENIEENGIGSPEEEWWKSFEQFCVQYVYSEEEGVFGIIDRMCISEKEKEKLSKWVQGKRKGKTIQKHTIFETKDRSTSWEWKLENLTKWLEKIGFRFDERKHLMIPLNKYEGEDDYHLILVDGFEPVKSILGEHGLIKGKIEWSDGKHFLEVTKRQKEGPDRLYYYLMPEWIYEAINEDEQIREIFKSHPGREINDISRQRYWDDSMEYAPGKYPEQEDDGVDDDWLGPHPDETWSDLYEKD